MEEGYKKVRSSAIQSNCQRIDNTTALCIEALGSAGVGTEKHRDNDYDNKDHSILHPLTICVITNDLRALPIQ